MREREELVYCPECGNEVYPGRWRPCSNCGYDGEEGYNVKVLVSKDGKRGRFVGEVPF